MRIAALSLLAAATAATACSAPASPGEQYAIDTPAFTLQPGEEKFYCYHTTLPNLAPTGIRRMASRMPAGSHHMIVYKVREPLAADGTLVECEDFGMPGTSIVDIPLWLYAAQEPEREFVLPDDVGMKVAAGQPVVVNMHYINQSDEPLTASVHVELDAFAPGEAFTEAHSYVTFNTQIDVAPGATGSAGGSCAVRPDAKFVSLSTHSHKYTTRARIQDGDAVIVETLDWSHATVQEWAAPFHSFSTGKLDYRCDYMNPTNQRLRTGESAVVDEMCMAVGVFFPSVGDTFCLNSLTITL